jgi:hypothetical protein
MEVIEEGHTLRLVVCMCVNYYDYYTGPKVNCRDALYFLMEMFSVFNLRQFFQRTCTCTCTISSMKYSSR